MEIKLLMYLVMHILTLKDSCDFNEYPVDGSILYQITPSYTSGNFNTQ